MTYEGTMEEHLGILIAHYKDGSFRMSQPFLIDRIIQYLPGMKDTRSTCTPIVSGTVLTKDEEGECRK